LVLYNLIKGTSPPKAAKRKPNEVLNFPVGTTKEVANAIESALELDAIDRPPSVKAWLNLLPDPVPLETPPTLPPEEQRKRRLENWQLGLLLLGTLFAAFQGIMAIVSYVRPQKEAPPVQSSPIASPVK
jgi:hypothetical protein